MIQTQTKEIKKISASERFVNAIMKEFIAITGDNSQFSIIQKKLAQHLFIKIDQSLKSLESKRLSKGQNDKLSYTWENINLSKLAIDAVHRINLGLDALIPNHISPIPYWNSNEKKYDLDLRIGYIGKDFYKRNMAIEKPIDIIYELITETDHFKPIKKDINHETENYEFEIKQPFNRSKIIGGFGYIVYEDCRLNKLIIVSEKDFQKAEKNAKNNEFWKEFPIEMRYKTLVHRTTEKLTIDPQKINESFIAVEENDQENQILTDIEENANKKMIDIEPEKEEVRQEIKSEQQTQKPTAPVNRISKDGNTKIIDDNMQQESQAQMKGPGF